MQGKKGFPQQREEIAKLSPTQSPPCAKGGGFCAAKLGGIVLISFCRTCKSSILLRQSLSHSKAVTAPFAGGSLYVGVPTQELPLCWGEPNKVYAACLLPLLGEAFVGTAPYVIGKLYLYFSKRNFFISAFVKLFL